MVATIPQASREMDIERDEDHRRAVQMKVPQEPPAPDVPYDGFDG